MLYMDDWSYFMYQATGGSAYWRRNSDTRFYSLYSMMLYTDITFMIFYNIYGHFKVIYDV